MIQNTQLQMGLDIIVRIFKGECVRAIDEGKRPVSCTGTLSVN
jgi:hypothetical protein